MHNAYPPSKIKLAGYPESFTRDENLAFKLKLYANTHKALKEQRITVDALAKQTALELALYYREQADSIQMTRYLALAAKHSPPLKLAQDVADTQFKRFFEPHPDMMFLGSIIADPTIKRIDSLAPQLTDASIAALCYVLKTKPSIQFIDLRDQKISKQRAKAFVETLKNHHGIKTLYFSNKLLTKEAKIMLQELSHKIDIIFEDQCVAHTPYRK